MEIVSMHIRKTAGISFRKILRDVYGETLSVEYPSIKEPITEKTRVVHGHFEAYRYSSQFPEAKCITWVREPISRLRSQYLFWKYHGRKEGILGANPFMQSVISGEISFFDFCTHESMLNTYAYCFQHMTIDQFYFIGISERFTEDVITLGVLLGWPKNIEIPFWNRIEENIEADDTSALQEIQSLTLSANEEAIVRQTQKIDIDLYNHILLRRGYSPPK